MTSVARWKGYGLFWVALLTPPVVIAAQGVIALRRIASALEVTR